MLSILKMFIKHLYLFFQELFAQEYAGIFFIGIALGLKIAFDSRSH